MLRSKLPFFLAYASARQQPIFIDYIESTGSEYINTDYIMTSDNQEVECEFQYTDSSGTQCLCGTLPGANRGITPYITNGDDNFYVHTGQPAVLKFLDFDYTAKHSLYVRAVVGQGVYGKLDNTEQTTATVLTIINKSNPYFLFCRNNGTNNRPDTSYFKGRIYKFKMYDDGVLVRDMRPCINPSTNEVCMYDMVTGTYFYNQGTGNFIPAPRFVEYLESDGNQLIDTGLYHEYTWRIESTWLATVASKTLYSANVQDKRLFGRSGGGTWWFGTTTCGSNTTKLPLDTINTTSQDKNGVVMNGVLYPYTTEAVEFEPNTFYAVNLFGLKTDASVGFVGRVYSYKVYNNDVLIQDLRPCLQGNTPCMYDMVEGKYYMNVGTGTFGYGELKFVEYIESDGNQYIDTGLIGNFNTKAEVKFATNSVSVYPAVFGARAAANSKAFNIWGRLSSGYIGANISNKGYINSVVIPNVDTKYTVSLSNNQLLVNGNIKTFTGVIDFTTPTTMLLFDINGGGTHTGTGSNKPLNGRVYYLKVWENDMLIQDLRPVLDYNNVACMYDMVTGTYFYNQGTGEFIVGGR